MSYQTMHDTVEPLRHLGPFNRWNDRKRIVVAAMVHGWLLEPEKPRVCARIQARLLAARYNDLVATFPADSAKKWRRMFGELFLGVLPVLTRGSVQAHEKGLAFDMFNAVTGMQRSRDGRKRQGTRYGSHIRDILTAALIVLVMHDSTRNKGSRWLGPDRAKCEIKTSYSRELPNALFVMSPSEMDRAWRKYQGFAPLAAALLLFIGKKGWTCFQSAERECWRKEIDIYLAYAGYFQKFLKMLGSKSDARPGYIRYECNLVELPLELEQAWSPREDDRLTELLPRRGKISKIQAAKHQDSSAAS
jgi:hypothetical protein